MAKSLDPDIIDLMQSSSLEVCDIYVININGVDYTFIAYDGKLVEVTP